MRNAPPKKEWLIKGIFALGETSAWIGPPGSLKSSLLAEAGFVIASNIPEWHGFKTKRTGAVIYFALERAGLVERRLLASQNRAGECADDPPIAVEPGIKDLTNPAIVEHIIAIVREVEKATDSAVVMVIIDTFAKAIAAGGLDEDKAAHQGRVFANIQRLKDCLGETSPHVALIGHMGKDETRGARGSNAIRGDVDLMVEITGDTIKTANAVKSNDGEEGPLFSFKGETVVDRIDEDGDPERITIISAGTISLSRAEDKCCEPKLTPNQRTLFGILHAAGGAGLTLEDWNARAKQEEIGTRRKADLTDIRNALLSKGLVTNYGERWKVRHE
jgi:hypothetical protein